MSKAFSILFSILFLSHFLFAQASTSTDSCNYTIDAWTHKLNGGLQLDKPWKFKAGDNKDWSKADFNDSNWNELNSILVTGYDLDTFKKVGFKKIGWFRTCILIDSSVANKPIELKIENMGAMEVFWDGKLIANYGQFSDSGKADYQNQEFPVTLNPGYAGKHTLAVRFENKNFDKQTSLNSSGFSISIFNPILLHDKIAFSQKYISLITLSIGFVFVTLFIIHLFMFLFYRKERSNLFFSLFSLTMASLILIIYTSFNITSIALKENLRELGYSSFFLSIVFLSTLLNFLFGKFGIVYKLIIGFAIVSFILPYISPESTLFDIMSALSIILLVSETLFLIIRAIIKKQKGAKIIGAGFLFFLISLILLLTIGLIFGGISFSGDNYFAIYASLSFGILLIFSIPFSISAYLAWNFAQTNKNLEKQISNVENLAQEKQQILETQNEVLEQQVADRTKEIESEKKKSDELLLNILPEEIAEELKQTGSSKAQKYDEVSVLFTDFVNFTKISEQLGVDELLQELNHNFTAFDKIMERHGLEKIKTIGDAYLAVCGLPIANPNHAKSTVLAALDILAFVEQRKKETPYALDIRIGINSGSLIAGIIGVKKFAYDIWGDTVNTAARMEQSGSAGKINVSENTYQLIKNDFDCEYRGKIDAKGKGEMDMYFIKEKK